jgi:hypothetical protein
MEATLHLMAEGKLRLRPLITHLVACRDAPAMYHMALEKSAPFLGITFNWQ